MTSIITELKNEAHRHFHARHRITDHDMIDCWFEDGEYRFLRNNSPLPEFQARELVGETVRISQADILNWIKIVRGPNEGIEKAIYNYLYRVNDSPTSLKMTSSVDAGLTLIERAGYEFVSVTRYFHDGYYIAEVRTKTAGETKVITFKAATLPLAVAGAALTAFKPLWSKQ